MKKNAIFLISILSLIGCGMHHGMTEPSIADPIISERIHQTTPAIVRITRTETDEENPVWSPDGTRLAFESRRDGNKEIYTMDAGGEHTRNLTRNPADDDDPIWSPDGQRLIFVSNRWEGTTWKMSPALMYSFALSTACSYRALVKLDVSLCSFAFFLER